MEEISFTLTCLQSFPINFRYSQDRIYSACSKYFEPGTSADTDTVARCSHRQHRYTSNFNRAHAQYHSDLRRGKEAVSLNMPQFPTFGGMMLQAAGAHWHKQSSQCLQDRLYTSTFLPQSELSMSKFCLGLEANVLVSRVSSAITSLLSLHGHISLYCPLHTTDIFFESLIHRPSWI